MPEPESLTPPSPRNAPDTAGPRTQLIPSSHGTRLVAAAGAMGLVTLMLLLASLGSSRPTHAPLLSPVTTHLLPAGSPSEPWPKPRQPGWCPYGTLPASWSSESSGPGTHWQTFDARCRVRELLSVYCMPVHVESHAANATAADPEPLTILDPDDKLSDEERADTARAAAVRPGRSASIMFISDSVDRHIMTYLCEHAGGKMKAIVLREALSGMGILGGSVNASQAAPHSTRAALGHGGSGGSGGNGGSGGRALQRHLASTVPGMSAANASGYVVNSCSLPSGRLHLLASYIPGVHPTGPYHKQRKLSFKQRVDHATTVWRTYSSAPPDIVVVSSMLWDIARISAFEPWLAASSELPRSLLESWAANYTRVVQYAQRVVPQAKLFVYHTAMTPRHDSTTGNMEKAYLGRANHVRQLNAVGRHVADQMGMEVIDYAAVASRFQEGQAYLTDLIHPGLEVGLELANLYLNYVEMLHETSVKGSVG